MTTVCEVSETKNEQFDFVVSLSNVCEDERGIAASWLSESAKRFYLVGEEIHIASTSDLAMVAMRWF